MVFLSPSLLSNSPNSRLRLAHEISHAWFGLHIGARIWTEEWISEGFATYCEDRIDYLARVVRHTCASHYMSRCKRKQPFGWKNFSQRKCMATKLAATKRRGTRRIPVFPFFGRPFLTLSWFSTKNVFHPKGRFLMQWLVLLNQKAFQDDPNQLLACKGFQCKTQWKPNSHISFFLHEHLPLRCLHLVAIFFFQNEVNSNQNPFQSWES